MGVWRFWFGVSHLHSPTLSYIGWRREPELGASPCRAGFSFSSNRWRSLPGRREEEVFRAAIIVGAAAVVLMHNHPRGEPAPSEADIKVTRDLIRAGQLLNIEVLDHVIVGRDRHISLCELGYLSGPRAAPQPLPVPGRGFFLRFAVHLSDGDLQTSCNGCGFAIHHVTVVVLDARNGCLAERGAARHRFARQRVLRNGRTARLPPLTHLPTDDVFRRCLFDLLHRVWKPDGESAKLSRVRYADLP